jgi:hypothetical protein
MGEKRPIYLCVSNNCRANCCPRLPRSGMMPSGYDQKSGDPVAWIVGQSRGSRHPAVLKVTVENSSPCLQVPERTCVHTRFGGNVLGNLGQDVAINSDGTVFRIKRIWI